MVKVTDSGPPIESKRIVPMLLVGLVLISMAGVLIIGASGQVQGLDSAQTMIAHGPVLASNQTELVDLIGLNGLSSDSSSWITIQVSTLKSTRRIPPIPSP